MLTNSKDTRFAITFLDDGDFYSPSCNLSFLAIKNLYARGDDIDLLTVVEELIRMGSLEEAGGPYAISMMGTKVYTDAHIQTHIRILKQKSLQRRLIILCSEKITDAFDSSKDIFTTIDDTMLQLTKMNEGIEKADSTKSIQDVTNSFLDDMESEEENDRFVWETGYKKFDNKVGLTKDKILLFAGGAKHGKSKFVMAMMFAILEKYNDVSIYWVTLEDSAKDIAAGYLATKIFVKPKDIKRRQFSDTSRNSIRGIMDKFNSFDIVFQEQSARSWKIANEFANFCKVRPGRFNVLIVDNVLALSDREDFKGAENSMYDYVMNQMLNIRQKTKGCIIPIHHYKDSQQSEDRIKSAFRPRLMDMKGTEAFRRIPNSVLLINNPGKYDDLMNEYGEYKDSMRHLFIVDTGANREDTSDDDTALIRFVHSLDYNIFIEI